MRKAVGALVLTVCIGVSGLALAAEVTDASEDVPDGALAIAGMADVGLVGYIIPLVGVLLGIGGGMSLLNNRPGETSGSKVGWTMIALALVAGATQLSTSFMETLGAASFSDTSHIKAADVSFPDPVFFGVLVAGTLVAVTLRRLIARRKGEVCVAVLPH